MDTITKQAVELYSQGFSCAQSVFAAFADELGVDRDTALKISSGFGGGMGRTGNVCGALTGAIMVIGYRNGTTDAANLTQKLANYDLVEKAISMFRERSGAIDCRDLIGYELLAAPEPTEESTEAKFRTCSKAVRDAAEIAAKILEL
ncbi:MAG: C_GCAxxG_C_C family protein [Anaerohalosphaera sp.]|nr:C_GCAxxG_C_C family protein [Anaerohalosphaera sp.]